MSVKQDDRMLLAKITGIWAEMAEDQVPQATIRGRLRQTLRATSQFVVRPRVMSDTQLTNTTVAARGVSGEGGVGEEGLMPPDYELQEKLGEGGMGIVYLARQTSIDRQIAVKMLKPELAKDDQTRARFLAEAAVTGELDHPNIVPIHDLGCNDQGHLFYSMKRVRGTPWSQVIAIKSQAENLDILLSLCDAIAFAHSHNILHRDIKPENVMLGDFGEVLVMDWGLAYSVTPGGKARLIDPTDAMAGTPAYMAPEMASGTIDQLSFASDIYLLGATLFEIVTGRPPHDGPNVMACLFNAGQNKIVSTDKTGELLHIAQKAMATRAEDRYKTVADFQAAIREYESHSESILLSTKATQQLARACQSNDYNHYAQAMFAFREAAELWSGNTSASRGASQAAFKYANSARQRGDLDLALSLLSNRDPVHVDLRVQVQSQIEDRQLRARRYKQLGRSLQIALAAILLLMAGSISWIWQEQQRARSAERQAKDQKANAVAQAQAAEDARQEAETQRQAAEQNAQVAEQNAQAAEKQRKRAQSQTRLAQQAKQSADEAKIRAEQNAQAARDAQREEERGRYDTQLALAVNKATEEFNFQGVASLLSSAPAAYRNWEYGRLSYLLEQAGPVAGRHDQRIDAVAFSPDGTRALTVAWDGTAAIWEVPPSGATLQRPRRRILLPVGAYIFTAAFLKNDQVLIGDNKGRIQIWDVREHLVKQPTKIAGQEGAQEKPARLLGEIRTPASPLAHPGGVNALALSADGSWLISGGDDRAVRFWKRSSPAGSIQPSYDLQDTITDQHNAAVLAVAFSTQSTSSSGPPRLFASADQRGSVVVGPVPGASRSAGPTAGQIAQASQSRSQAGRSQAGRSQAGRSGDIRVFLGHTGAVRALAFTEPVAGLELRSTSQRLIPVDGQQVISSGDDGVISVWHYPTEERVQLLTGHRGTVDSIDVAVVRRAGGSPQQLILTGGADNTIRLWDLELGRAIKTFLGHSGRVSSVAFSPDANRLLTGSHDATARIWDREAYAAVRPLASGVARPQVFQASLSGDGHWAVVASRDRATRIYQLNNQREFLTLNEGHTRPIQTADLSPDGRFAVTAGTDRTVRLWRLSWNSDKTEPRQGQAIWQVNWQGQRPGGAKAQHQQEGQELVWGYEIQQFSNHTGTVRQVVFSDDSSKVASGGDDGNICVWDLDAIRQNPNAQVKPLMITVPESLNDRRSVRSVALSADGSQLLAGTRSRDVLLFETTNGQLLRRLNGHTKEVTYVSFLPSSSGPRAVSSSNDNTTTLWDLSSGQRLRQTLPHEKDVLGLAVSPDGSMIATRSLRGFTRTLGGRELRSSRMAAMLWDRRGPQKGKPKAILPHGETNVTALAFHPQGRHLAVGTSDGQVHLWDCGAPRMTRPMRSWPAQDRAILSLAFHPNGRWILVGGEKTATFWNTQGQVVGSLGGQSPALEAVFVPGGRATGPGNTREPPRYVVAVNYQQPAKLWDTRTKQAVLRYQNTPDEQARGVAVSPDGQTVATYGANEIVKLWERDSAKLKVAIDTSAGDQVQIQDVSFSPEGDRIVVASSDLTAKIYTVDGTLLQQLGDGQLGAGDADRPDVGHRWWVLSATFSPDGKQVITTGADYTARLWNAETGEELQVLTGHTAFVTDAAFTPDGKRILTASDDSTVKLWNAETGREILRLKEHTQGVTSVSVSKNGRLVMTSSKDGRTLVWPSAEWRWWDFLRDWGDPGQPAQEPTPEFQPPDEGRVALLPAQSQGQSNPANPID